MLNWYENNQMKTRKDYFDVLVNAVEAMKIKVCLYTTTNISKKLLGVKLDCKLS